MRFVLILSVVIAAVAGSAAAEFGQTRPSSGFQKPKSMTEAAPAAAAYGSAYGSAYGAAPAAPTPKMYATPPAAPAYKPYEPYKSQPGTSLFGPDGKKKP